MGARKRNNSDSRKELKKSLIMAKLNNCPTSPRKMRLVADQVRGKDVNKALSILKFSQKQASLRLEKFGYNNVTVHIADGYNGLPDEAPFDRIIVTAASEEVPETLIGQLSEGGIMILPIGKQFEIQYLWLIKKEMDGTIIREKILPVRFLPIVRK